MHRRCIRSIVGRPLSCQGRMFRWLVAIGILAAFPAQQAMAQTPPSLTQYPSSTANIIAGTGTDNGYGTEDGQPALSTYISPLFVAPPDSSGNIYYTDSSNGPQVRVVYGGVTVPPLLNFALTAVANATGQPKVVPQKGEIYTIVNASLAGGTGPTCPNGATCGDTGQAALAFLNSPTTLAFDSQGNLYISDSGDYCIRRVSVADGTITTYAGDPNHANSTFNGDNIQASTAYLSYPQQIAFDPNDNLYIADIGSNLVRRVDNTTNHIITTVAGDPTQPATYCGDNNCGDGGPATQALLGGVFGVAVNGSGDIFISEQNTAVVREISHISPNDINTYAGEINMPCAAAPCSGSSAIGPYLVYPTYLSLDANGNLVITDNGNNAIRAVLPDGSITTIAGQINLSPTVDSGSGGPAGQVQLYGPTNAVFDASYNLFVADVFYLWQVNAPKTLQTQTITYTAPTGVQYGNPPIDLDNYFKTNSSLSISYALVSGPGSISGSTLTITGADASGNDSNPIKVTASQAGNSTWAAAVPVTESIDVAQAPLTVTESVTLQQGAAIPNNLANQIHVTGFVNGDTQSSVVTGTATATVVDASGVALPPGTVPAAGAYTINLAKGTLSAGPNYSLSFVSGQLLVTAGQKQTITIGAFTPPTIYGAANSSFSFSVSSDSGLPVNVAFTGPVRTQQTSSGWSVTVAGAGQVTITASQTGNSTYAPATTVSQFTVNPAALTITASNIQAAYGATPVFAYASSGFVSNDNASVLSGAPSVTSTATTSSAPGNYPISIVQGTLFAQNYTFNFVGGTLTVTKAAQTINFPPLANVTFATSQPVNLQATATSGLPVAYTVAGPAQLNGNQLQEFSGVGTVTVTATQAGNQDYAAATPVTQSFNVVMGVLPISANNATRPYGADNPTFTYQVGIPGAVIPANEYSGVPVLTTTANASSPPGTYPIIVNQGTLASNDLTFQFIPGTLTILPPSSFILTANNTSLTVPRGQARQVTITLTPVNDFVGSVTIGCNSLPAGVTCVASPATLTTTLNASGSGVQPVTTTLTVSAGDVVASAENRQGSSNIYAAGWLGVPGVLFGVLLSVRRRQLFRNLPTQPLLLLMAALLLCACGLTACGGGSNSSTSGIQPGTTVIQVTGSGTSTTGPATGSLALTVTVQ
jgi:MBG domain (YGX type)